MLDVSGGELIVILLVALVVFGPQRLPDLARRAGQWSRELRNAARELRAGLEAEVKEVKEAVEEVRQPLREAKAELRQATGAFDDAAQQARLAWRGPQPAKGPTAKEALEDLDRIEQGLPPDSRASGDGS